MVKNLSANAGDAGSITGWETDPTWLGATKPSSQRKNPCAAAKTQCGQINTQTFYEKNMPAHSSGRVIGHAQSDRLIWGVLGYSPDICSIDQINKGILD